MEQKTAQTQTCTCPGCGAQMAFDPSKQALCCPYCETTVEIDSELITAPEYRFDPYTQHYDAPRWDLMDKVVVRCASCGAETIVEPSALTAFCPFCGSSSQVQVDAEDGGILPETLVPFKVTEQQAIDCFRKWIRKKYFAPMKFAKQVIANKMQGLYVPYWTFDANVNTQYSGMGGRYYYVTRTRTNAQGKTETYRERRIHWYPVNGTKQSFYDNIPSPATQKINPSLLRQLGGFTGDILRQFDMRFLAGFHAERYDISLSDAWETERPGVERRIESDIEAELGYDTYNGMRYEYHYLEMRFKHIFVPVWMSSYRFKDKTYTFLVNGESGRAAGNAPVSVAKVIGLVAVIAMLAVGLFFLYRYLGA